MKFGKTSFVTKIVILVLFVVFTIQLLNLHRQIQTARADYNAVAAKVTAQEAANAALEEDIQHADDPDTVLDIAKEKLGLSDPGEVIFYDTTN